MRSARNYRLSNKQNQEASIFATNGVTDRRNSPVKNEAGYCEHARAFPSDVLSCFTTSRQSCNAPECGDGGGRRVSLVEPVVHHALCQPQRLGCCRRSSNETSEFMATIEGTIALNGARRFITCFPLESDHYRLFNESAVRYIIPSTPKDLTNCLSVKWCSLLTRLFVKYKLV